jgi:glycosyl transferase, family 25
MSIIKIILFLITVLFISYNFFCKPNNETFFNKKKYNIYFINLKHRTDRKKKFIQEIKKLDSLENHSFKHTRIDAIKDIEGSIGCGKSHIKALQKAKQNNLPYVIIMEDDINIKTHEIEKCFKILKDLEEWDVFILSGHGKKKKINDDVSKAIGIQTTGMYIIKNNYYDTLINCFQESVDRMTELKKQKKNINEPRWAIDMNWKLLQKKDNWLILNKNLGIQRANYSDIENKIVNYSNMLN